MNRKNLSLRSGFLLSTVFVAVSTAITIGCGAPADYEADPVDPATSPHAAASASPAAPTSDQERSAGDRAATDGSNIEGTIHKRPRTQALQQ